MIAHESQETNYDLTEEEKDNKRSLQYLNSCLKFLPTAPTDHPHLIDPATLDETTDQTYLTAADGIATLLFKWKPEALDSFLNIKSTRKFKFYRREALSSSMYDIFIGRFGKFVMWGYREGGDWVDKVLNFTIEESGAWKPVDRQSQSGSSNFATVIMYHKKWIAKEGVSMELH